MKFYRCNHCGNIIAYVYDAGVQAACCGEKMQEIVPGSVDASHEKHVPVWKAENNVLTVTVGSVEHPMTAEHQINWVAVETKLGNQRAERKPGEKPVFTFALLPGDEVKNVYAYCNLHGLWKA